MIGRRKGAKRREGGGDATREEGREEGSERERERERGLEGG